MKKLLLTLTLVMSAIAANAQNKAATTAASLEKGRSTLEYSFIFPAEISAEQVNKSKDYYTSYFTVNYNAKSHEAVVHLTSNDEMNRKVIQRFLMSSGIQTVTVDGKDLPVHEMYEKYLADKK